MKTNQVNFRGQEAVVFEGGEPKRKAGHFYYGIRRHETENIPLTIEGLVVLNRWGTIETKHPIAFDGRNSDQANYDRTSLTLAETMDFLQYNQGYNQVG